MAANDQRLHLKIDGFSTTHGFATPQSGRANFKIAERSRREHGRNLLQQLRAVSEAAEERIEEQHRLSNEIPNGIYVQFESEPGFELASDSLGREASGIELLSVTAQGRKYVATVFVPEGKLEIFERLVKAYLETRPGQSDKHRHQQLLNNISHIRVATLRALWTDDRSLYPRDQTTPVWWEVWLRVGDDREAFLKLFREQGTALGLTISPRSLGFLERTVIAVKGSVQQMTRSVFLLNCVAELRRLKATAEFFIDLKPVDQAAWTNDLHQRIAWPGAEAPAVCLLDTGVVAAHPLLTQAFASADLHTINPTWTTADAIGHGTSMAGLALHGDLTEVLPTTGPVDLLHRGESVKLLNKDGDNEGELYGELTREAIARAEAAAPTRTRTICMAVTATEDRDRGRPSSWSATIDALASGAEDEHQRLIVVSAGNTDPNNYEEYPGSNTTDSIHDPAQAWNALTIGGFTCKTEIDLASTPGATPLAPYGDLSPFSCTSATWERGWPLKPDVVMEGGNLALTPPLGASDLAELQLLTTHFRPNQMFFDLMSETSAATALAARLGARIQAQYPELWPETVRGLIVHSASWTPAMIERFKPKEKRTNARQLLRHCGHGVPSESLALWSASNALTLVVETEIIPFERATDSAGRPAHFRAREMHLHALPWPIDELNELGATEVEMRVTLSYFIEPNPSARGWTKRYLYESHGLRFDVKRPLEGDADFLERINLRARAEEDRRATEAVPDDGWLLGNQLRHMGSIHSDRWRGSASDLAARGQIGVYPTMGWWRERRQHERWNSKARYALLVSITTQATDIDLYAAIQARVEAATEIQIR
jgi:hypothetical protein